MQGSAKLYLQHSHGWPLLPALLVRDTRLPATRLPSKVPEATP